MIPIPGLGKLKTILLAIVSSISLVFLAIIKSNKAKEAEEKAKRAESSLKQKSEATDALVDGLQKEQEIRNEKVDTPNRNHFN